MRAVALVLTLAVIGCGSSAVPEAPSVALRGGPFVCEGSACMQRFVAMPDDGEWECIEVDGVALCRGGVPPAGVRAGPADPAFECGSPLAGDDAGRRVCVDPEPDVPAAPRTGWRCRFERDAGVLVRWCERDPERATVAAACRESCPPGMTCVRGRCDLARGAPPNCWVDGDCMEEATCVLARCTPR